VGRRGIAAIALANQEGGQLTVQFAALRCNPLQMVARGAIGVRFVRDLSPGWRLSGPQCRSVGASDASPVADGRFVARFMEHGRPEFTPRFITL
jgi:hypothetical protein